jgi:hypothetical protein
MIKRVIINEAELKRVLHDSVVHALVESRCDSDIKKAQKELYQMANNLNSIGLRLEGSKFEALYTRMNNAIIKLNNALIKEIRKEKK